MERLMISVELPGPPSVSTLIVANVLNASTRRSRAAMAMNGRNSGSVTCQNAFHTLAPSTDAASSGYLGTPCNPAMRISATNGFHFQTSSATMETQLVVVSLSLCAG